MYQQDDHVPKVTGTLNVWLSTRISIKTICRLASMKITWTAYDFLTSLYIREPHCSLCAV